MLLEGMSAAQVAARCAGFRARALRIDLPDGSSNISALKKNIFLTFFGRI
jgi:hypothetical protein